MCEEQLSWKEISQLWIVFILKVCQVVFLPMFKIHKSHWYHPSSSSSTLSHQNVCCDTRTTTPSNNPFPFRIWICCPWQVLNWCLSIDRSKRTQGWMYLASTVYNGLTVSGKHFRVKHGIMSTDLYSESSGTRWLILSTPLVKLPRQYAKPQDQYHLPQRLVKLHFCIICKGR